MNRDSRGSLIFPPTIKNAAGSVNRRQAAKYTIVSEKMKIEKYGLDRFYSDRRRERAVEKIHLYGGEAIATLYQRLTMLYSIATRSCLPAGRLARG